ncbi:MAG TPA: SDR family NAD(P)-dependent oxidoreductase [Candidatus Limnocylindria bacterium]|nr:SDR family NAD(P)-dependent oxidoreductase [Candidatus Limnocylindria bacterium]
MEGKVVIVTGGAKGIGRHAARTLAQAGATVVIADADAERMHKTLAEVRALTKEAIAVPTDVRDEKDVRHMVYTVADRFGRIDALINDAGIVPHFNWGVPRWPRVRYLSKDFWDSVIQTNLGGTFLCTKYVVPFMEERRSGTSSTSGAAAGRKTMAHRRMSSAKMPFAPLRDSSPKKKENGTSAPSPSAPSKPSPPKTRRKRRASACPARKASATASSSPLKPAWN